MLLHFYFLAALSDTDSMLLYILRDQLSNEVHNSVL